MMMLWCQCSKFSFEVCRCLWWWWMMYCRIRLRYTWHFPMKLFACFIMLLLWMMMMMTMMDVMTVACVWWGFKNVYVCVWCFCDQCWLWYFTIVVWFVLIFKKGGKVTKILVFLFISSVFCMVDTFVIYKWFVFTKSTADFKFVSKSIIPNPSFVFIVDIFHTHIHHSIIKLFHYNVVVDPKDIWF